MTPLFKTLGAAALFSMSISAPAFAGSLQSQNAACSEALSAELEQAASDVVIRFDKRRGAGKKQRLMYSIKANDLRGKATCMGYRDEIKEISFDEDFAVKLAAAE